MAGIVAVFDFDKTIVDVDSDNWVVDELGFTALFNELLPTMPWNSLMDRMMQEIHSQGKTVGDIEEVFARIPIHPRIVPAIKSVYTSGCELRIVSDANIFFIETILKQLRIRDYYSEINTNPGFINGEGRVRISPFHDFTKSAHGCPLCPPNMCKGVIIDTIQASLSKEYGNNKRIIYLGDWNGDYCPSLRLKETDYVMPRKNFPLWELIRENPKLVKAEIHEWTNGEELERAILQLIRKISVEEEKAANSNSNSNLVAGDCKSQTISVGASNDSFFKAVPVPQ